jgi:hypothetical protein
MRLTHLPIIQVVDGVGFVPLTNGFVALVDAADVPAVRSFKWFAHCAKGHAYATTHKAGTREQIKMHRYLLGAAPGEWGDHINGDTLNNRRSNLRLASPTQNRRNRGISRNNSSGKNGVIWCPSESKWSAQIYLCGRRIKKRFNSFEDALSWRLTVEREAYGEFARVA